MNETTSIKENLYNHYLKQWNGLRKELRKHEIYSTHHHAHLLSTDEGFEKRWASAKTRVMIFGIATNGWGRMDKVYELPDSVGINQLMNNYEEFYFGGGNWRYGHPFWNYFYSIKELLSYKLDGSVEVIWSNVHKIHPKMQELESRLFDVTPTEIRLFNPDIILLLGKGDRNLFMNRIKDFNVVFKKDVTYKEDTKEKILYHEYDCIDDRWRMKKIFVTYHPNAYGESGIKLKLMLDNIVNTIKTK